MNYKKTQGWLVAGFLAAATPFVTTEVTGTDYCLKAARTLSGSTVDDTKLFLRHLPDYDTAALDPDRWGIRLAVTPFPSPSQVYKPNHASLEFFHLATGKVHAREMIDGEYQQIHGMIVDADTGKLSGISPCDVRSLWQQATSRNLLSGVESGRDVNRRILGHDPVAYIDLYYGSKEDVMRKRSAAGDFMRELNAKKLTYGFHNPPNSNTFVAYLLERMNLPSPDDVVSDKAGRNKFWLPGFIKGLFPETITAASSPMP